MMIFRLTTVALFWPAALFWPVALFWPGLHIRQQWKLADQKQREIDIDCRIGLARSKPDVGQVVFYCDASLQTNCGVG